MLQSRHSSRKSSIRKSFGEKKQLKVQTGSQVLKDINSPKESDAVAGLNAAELGDDTVDLRINNNAEPKSAASCASPGKRKLKSRQSIKS